MSLQRKISLGFVCVICLLMVSSYTVEALRLSVPNYLKSRFFGIAVNITDSNAEFVDEGIPRELISSDKQYGFSLKDGRRVKVVFEVTKVSNLDNLPRDYDSQARLHASRVDAAQYMNLALSPLTDGASTTEVSADLITPSALDSLSSQFGEKGFERGEEIIYTNISNGEEMIGELVVNNWQLFLKNGTPISIRFELDYVE
jgi:hypothetical protein